MNAEEQYLSDYTLIVLVLKLAEAQEQGQHGVFSGILGQLWMNMLTTLPTEVRAQLPAVLLDAYFRNAGNMRKALAGFEECLQQAVGYTAHRSAMDRLRASPAQELLDKVLNAAYGEKQT